MVCYRGFQFFFFQLRDLQNISQCLTVWYITSQCDLWCLLPLPWEPRIFSTAIQFSDSIRNLIPLSPSIDHFTVVCSGTWPLNEMRAGLDLALVDIKTRNFRCIDNYSVVQLCLFLFFDLMEVSLPKLVDFDWRVDVKTSSNAISRMSMPTCIMQLQVSWIISNWLLSLKLNTFVSEQY